MCIVLSHELRRWIERKIPSTNDFVPCSYCRTEKLFRRTNRLRRLARLSRNTANIKTGPRGKAQCFQNTIFGLQPSFKYYKILTKKCVNSIFFKLNILRKLIIAVIRSSQRNNELGWWVLGKYVDEAPDVLTFRKNKNCAVLFK